MTRCSVCQLSSEKRAAIDSALREGVPLQALSDRTGVTKSSLFRHSHHSKHRDESSDDQPEKAVAASQESAVPASPQRSAPPVTGVDLDAKRQQVLDRVSMLWDEALSGLEAAKEPVTLTKADGSVLELPGDLRARAGFLREGRGVLDLEARLRGLTDSVPQGSSIVIVAGDVYLQQAKSDEPESGIVLDLPSQVK